MDVLQVGLLGCGNVGSAVVRMLYEHAEDIVRRSGIRIEVACVGVRDPSKPRDVPIPGELFTTDVLTVATAPEIDVVVELIGGVEPARTLVLAAFAAGKPVVTANKELLASHAEELFGAAAARGVDLLYEASVGGGIPLIRPLRESLAGDRIGRFLGIVNGTTNYVLTRMTEDGLDLDAALAEAQALGFAEADPSADIEGHDAAAKAAILATIAFDLPVAADDVYREGITRISRTDIEFAAGLGYVIKLLAVGEAGDGDISVRVHPAMIPKEHPLASVRENFNAVFLEGDKVGPLMLYGKGAGGDPTATSVVGDLIELAGERHGIDAPAAVQHHRPALESARWTGQRRRRLRPIEELATQYYVLLRVSDRPGVLASVAGAFANHGVSIKSVRQEGHGEEAQLVLITHWAGERALRQCMDDVRSIESVKEITSVIRVELAEP